MLQSLRAPIDCKCGQLTINDWGAIIPEAHLPQFASQPHRQYKKPSRRPPQEPSCLLPQLKACPWRCGRYNQTGPNPIKDASTPPPESWLHTPNPRHSCVDVFRILLSNNLGFGNLKRWLGGPAFFSLLLFSFMSTRNSLWLGVLNS